MPMVQVIQFYLILICFQKLDIDMAELEDHLTYPIFEGNLSEVLIMDGVLIQDVFLVQTKLMLLNHILISIRIRGNFMMQK